MHTLWLPISLSTRRTLPTPPQVTGQFDTRVLNPSSEYYQVGNSLKLHGAALAMLMHSRGPIRQMC